MSWRVAAMNITTSRRDVVKLATGFVIGAGLAGGTAPVEAVGAVPRQDMAALTAWEDVLADASIRGQAWVQEGRYLYCFVLFALQQAEAAGASVLLDSLRPALAEAEAIHEARSTIFQAWADAAWALPDLAPLPPEPWA